MLLSAGIGSLALGIGAQSLIKDVVTGFFMMFEKQFSVGDYVKLDDIEGTVTATAMRVTYLKNFAGQPDYHTQRHDRSGDQLFPDGFAGEGYGQHAV